MKAITLIKEYRGNKSELSRMIGVSSQTMQMWVKRGSVPSKYLKELSKALSVKVENLL